MKIHAKIAEVGYHEGKEVADARQVARWKEGQEGQEQEGQEVAVMPQAVTES